MSADNPSSDRQFHSAVASFFYRLTVAFPSWASAILAVYSIFLWRFGALNIRSR